MNATDAQLAEHCPNCRRMLRSVPSLLCWEHGTDWDAEFRARRANANARLALLRVMELYH